MSNSSSDVKSGISSDTIARAMTRIKTSIDNEQLDDKYEELKTKYAFDKFFGNLIWRS